MTDGDRNFEDHEDGYVRKVWELINTPSDDSFRFSFPRLVWEEVPPHLRIKVRDKVLKRAREGGGVQS